MSNEKISKQCKVTGKVQGVCFRDATRRRAMDLGVCGSATNVSDGSVEVLIYGNKIDIDVLCAWLWHGSEMAQVESVHCSHFKSSELTDKQRQFFSIGSKY